MLPLQKLNSIKNFIDYKPAELRINKDWIIVYYSRVPAKQELKRFRLRVPKIKNRNERLRYAKKMVASINFKLELGWSPFYEDNNNRYVSFEYCCSRFIAFQEKEVKDGIKRQVTVDAYSSYLNMINKFIGKKRYEIKFVIEMDNAFVNSFLDYLYLEKDYSPRTHNNYLQFINTFFIWCKSKGYIKQNPAENIKSKTQLKKVREILRMEEKRKLKKFKETNFYYYVLCMCTYYCFIRRTELTKLKVEDVNLSRGFITILGENAKNKKTENVTIPNNLIPLLEAHLKNADANNFLFSKDDFKPGKYKITPKKISDTWSKFRKLYEVENKYQWYSLKDTGITDLLNCGIPSIKVRNQARHHDLKMTETYTQRNITSDNTVKNADFKF